MTDSAPSSSDGPAAKSSPVLPLSGGLSPTGIALLLAGTVLFSSKAILVKLAYGVGPQVDAITIMAYRMALALPCFVLMAVLSGRRGGFPRGRLLLKSAALGLLGYYVSMLADLSGLRYIGAGLERMILFIYPSLVVLILAVRTRRAPDRTTVFVLLLTYAGMALAVGDAVAMGGASANGGQVMLGSLLVAGAAVCFALYNVGAGDTIRRTGAAAFASVSMGTAALASILHYLLTHGPTAPAVPAGQVLPFLVICLIMALLATVLPSYLIASGMARISVAPATIIQTIGPLSTILMATLLLDEPITLMELSGGALIVIGVTALGRTPKKGRRN